MTQLFLDGQEVVPDAKSTIKFIRENPFFKKSSTYTYEVELPMGIDRNHRFFGNINRIDVAKEKTVYEARLVVDNITVLCGIGHITTVTETSVKVQLLGNEASYNFRNKFDNLFIDELDLGDWFWTTWPDGSFYDRNGWGYYPKEMKFTGISSPTFYRTQYGQPTGDSGKTREDRIFSHEYPWVAYPVMNSSADFLCNRAEFLAIGKDVRLRIYADERSDWEDRDVWTHPVFGFAVQPYIWLMAKKIAEATGFNLDDNDNALLKDPFFKRIFIVNANNMNECNKCLPHWSVNEWWTNIENAFGVVMSVDYASRSMVLRKRKDHYLQPDMTTVIHESEDAFTSEIDDDSEADISVCNVGFADHEDNPAMNLSEFITDNARVNQDFANLTELTDWAKGTDNMSDYKDSIFKCRDGRHFIYADDCGIDGNPGFIEVDMFRPRLTNTEKDVEVELKFVPAQFAEIEVLAYQRVPRPRPGDGYDDIPVVKMKTRALQVPNIPEMDWYKKHEGDGIDIEAILKGEEEETTKEDGIPDAIYIAIEDNDGRDEISDATHYNSEDKANYTFRYPRPLLHERAHAPIDGSPQLKDSPVSLSLIPIEGQTNLASATIGDSVDIDTKHRYCIRFLSKKIPEAGHIFIIRNRRFVCERIEVSISQRGIDRLMTGWFYEFSS